MPLVPVRTAAGSLDAVFGSGVVERFVWTFDGGLGGEPKKTALFRPVMRQVLAQLQEPEQWCSAPIRRRWRPP